MDSGEGKPRLRDAKQRTSTAWIRYNSAMHALNLLFALALLLSACAGTVDQVALQTAAAATLNAGVEAAQGEFDLQTAEAANAQLQATVNALATANAQLMIQGTATAVAGATLASITPQLVAPDGATCRVGPAGGFGSAGTLAAGQPYEVFGRSTDGEWWQVADPDDEGDTCWVFWDDEFNFVGEVFNLPLLAGPSLPTQTAGPTSAPGIAARFVHTMTCSGVRMAIIRVRNVGPETYQSAIVIVSDSNGAELHRSDGNNEFLQNDTTCPGGQPTLGPGQDKFVAVSVQTAAAGDTLTARVTVCTEKGYNGNCWSSTTQFVP